ncbi:MAG: LD-carboxypeptidase [Anaerolineaceae bacterium]|nr:LD-carboxypeptidase [Anaerolineaceae bacterium]
MLAKKLVKPKKLNPGDTIAAVTLSWGGPNVFPYRYESGKKQLEDAFEVKVVEMPHTLSEADWLRKNPQARADDLMQAFSDPSINGIISTIGGEDSIRILPYLDLRIIHNNPKVFMGYSDTTIAHFACIKAGVASFYGPAIMAGFAENEGLFPYMVKAVKRTLFSSEALMEIEPNRDGWTAEYLDWSEPKNQACKRKLNPSTGWKFLQGKGIYQGHLIGGCIEVLDWLRGTEIWPPRDIWHGAIFFIETSEDALSPIAFSRMLRALAAVGLLKEINGILFGRPGGQVPLKNFSAYEDALLQVVVSEEGLPNLPIVTRMDFGHTDPMMVLPYGIQCKIDCAQQKVYLTENAAVS